MILGGTQLLPLLISFLGAGRVLTDMPVGLFALTKAAVFRDFEDHKSVP
jgi:hypothetical protein